MSITVALVLLYGVAYVVGSPAFGADTSKSTAAVKPDPYAEFIGEAAQRYALPERWIRTVIQRESDGNARSVLPKGAMGLMQIMPETWNVLRDRQMLGADPFDLHDNIIGGTAYLHQLFDRYGAPGFLAAYNAGPGRYSDHIATGKPLQTETENYVMTVEPRLDAADTTTADQRPWSNAPLFIGHVDLKPAVKGFRYSARLGRCRSLEHRASPHPHHSPWPHR